MAWPPYMSNKSESKNKGTNNKRQKLKKFLRPEYDTINSRREADNLCYKPKEWWCAGQQSGWWQWKLLSIMILPSRFNCVVWVQLIDPCFMSSDSHELISHKIEWNTYHSLDLGDAHKDEAPRLRGTAFSMVLYF